MIRCQQWQFGAILSTKMKMTDQVQHKVSHQVSDDQVSTVAIWCNTLDKNENDRSSATSSGTASVTSSVTSSSHIIKCHIKCQMIRCQQWQFGAILSTKMKMTDQVQHQVAHQVSDEVCHLMLHLICHFHFCREYCTKLPLLTPDHLTLDVTLYVALDLSFSFLSRVLHQIATVDT